MPGTDVEQWDRLLGDVSHELTTLSTSTEDDFLQIGDHLRRLFIQAKEVTEVATSSAALIQGREIERKHGRAPRHDQKGQQTPERVGTGVG